MNEIGTREEPPPILYRYISWTDDQKKLLTENQVRFTAPKEFNDPFDCHVYAHPASEAAMKKYFSKVENQRDDIRALSPKEKKKWIAERVKKLGTEEGFWEENRRAFDLMNEQMGVFCLSGAEPKDSILMWSHYACKHQGLCVGLDTRTLDRSMRDIWINRVGDERHLFWQVFPVDYPRDYPCMSLFDENFKEGDYADMNLHTKSKGWEYEHEWRVVLSLNKGDCRICTLRAGVVKEVILGCRMCPDDRKAVKEVVRTKHEGVRLFRAKPRKDRFGLYLQDITK